MPPQLHETFRLNLRRRLRELGLSQRDFAKLMQVSDAYVSQVLNRDHVPTLETVDKIANKLQTNSLYFLTAVEAEEIPKSEVFPVDAIQ